MSLTDLLKMCAQNLRRRKGRTFLSVLGVVVGCCSIVCMLSIGVGMSASQEQWISEMGDLTAVDVYPNYVSDTKLDDELIAQLGELPNVTAVAAKLSFDAVDFTASVTAGPGGRYVSAYADVAGYSQQAMQALDYKLLEGCLPERKGTVAIGESFEYSLTDSKRPEGRNTVELYDPDTGEELTGEDRPKPFVSLSGGKLSFNVTDDDGKVIYTESFQVVGKLKQDYNVGSETDSGVLMQAEDFKAFCFNAQKAANLKRKTPPYSAVKVFADEINNVAAVEEAIKGMGFETSSMESMRESTKKEMATVQLALGGIGAVSLLVAAIGIMNTMIMSVSERTKEIGVMKALGCGLSDIRRLFLLEAASIGLLGGAVGSALSYLISAVIDLIYLQSGSAGEVTVGVIAYLLTSPQRISVIPLWLFLFGLLFSLLIGLVSGAYPAMKAVKISPLEAMKNE